MESKSMASLLVFVLRCPCCSWGICRLVLSRCCSESFSLVRRACCSLLVVCSLLSM